MLMFCFVYPIRCVKTAIGVSLRGLKGCLIDGKGFAFISAQPDGYGECDDRRSFRCRGWKGACGVRRSWVAERFSRQPAMRLFRLSLRTWVYHPLNWSCVISVVLPVLQ